MGNGLRYKIPKFQRDYTWEAEQWDDLWQDIQSLIAKEEEEHYMGYLVLQTSDNKSFLIIDGQQRLTTLSLLVLATLKCIQDLVLAGVDAANNQKRKDNLLNSYIGYIDPVTLISNNKLQLNRNSNDYFRQHLVLLKELPLRNTNTSEKHMRECFNWYYERIKKDYKTGEALAGFVETMADKLFFTAIEVTDQLNAFKVFETLNARGVQLSASDLLKNYLFSVVDESRPHISEIEELENIWGQIVGKLGEQKFEDYLRYYWNSSHKSVAKKNLFKTVKGSINTKEHVFELIRALNDTADLYLAIQNPEDAYWRDKPEVKKSLRALKLFQIRQTYALFLSGLKHLDAVGFEKLARVCAVVSLRYNVIGGLNPNAQEEVYNGIALRIAATKTFDTRDFEPVYVNDYNFENDFSTKEFKPTSRNHKIVKYILAKIELYLFNNEIDTESDLYTVEHVLPQNADEDWGDFSFEAINRSVYRIGNLTLLEKKANRAADRLPFTDKCKRFMESNAGITRSIPEKFETWDEEKIAARQRELAKHAKAIWKIQEI